MKKRHNLFTKFPALTGFFFLCFVFNCQSQNVTNYTFSATTGTFTQIQGVGGSVSPSLTAGSLDDGWFNSIAIGFPFTFEGTSYTTLSASTNGWFTFGTTLSASAFTNNLNTGTPRPVVAPFWDDLALNAAGGFTYYLSGTAPNQIMTLEWLNMKWNYQATTPVISFQVKLYENTKRIEFVYRQETGTVNSASASIGIAGVTSATFLSLNGTGAAPIASSVTETITLNTKPATGQIYDFDPYTSQPTITNVTPVIGPLATTVTITGTHFDPLTTANIVYFGATKATVLTASTTTLTVSVPAGTLYHTISVTTLASYLTAYSAKNYDVTFTCAGMVNSTSFNPRVNFATPGYTAQSAAVADIDGDGKPDVIVGNHGAIGSDFVSIFLNTSVSGIINSSSFAAPVNLLATNIPMGVAVGDIDGDGKQDIVASNYGATVISVFRNTSTIGTVSFTTKTDFTCGGSPRGVNIADMDLDGKADILVGCGTSNVIYLFRNISTPGTINAGSFSAPVLFTTIASGDSPYYLATGDIDGDGKPEMIATNPANSTASVFRNTSTPGTLNASSFAAKVDFATGSYPIGISIADIDVDGKLDFVTSNASGNNVSIFRNTATVGVINASSFAAKIDLGVGSSPYGVVVTDVDGDGKPDLATGNNGTATVSVIKNNCNPGSISVPSFQTAVNFAVSNTPYAITAGDIDGDSKPELITPHYGAGMMCVLENMVSSFTTIAPLTVTGTSSFCDNGTWKTYFDPANTTRVVAAIKDNGNNLGTVTVNEYEDGTPGTYNGCRYLARHFKITPTTQPVTPVQIRLYLTTAEFTALQSVDPNLITINNLAVTKYDGPTEDNVYSPGDATSLVFIPSTSIMHNSAYNIGYYCEFTISSFSEFWLHGGISPLPIELLNFSAAPEINHVNLNWSTATETNNDFFTVEKTKDGFNFETVAIINGAGNSTHLLNYSAVDENPYNGTSYYRLKQTDYNGQFSYSDIIAVNFVSEESLFSVFPNPSSGSVTINCPGDKNESVELTIYDNTGKLISRSQLTIGELDRQQLNLEQGIYSVIVTRTASRFVRSLIIL